MDNNMNSQNNAHQEPLNSEPQWYNPHLLNYYAQQGLKVMEIAEIDSPALSSYYAAKATLTPTMPKTAFSPLAEPYADNFSPAMAPSNIPNLAPSIQPVVQGGAPEKALGGHNGVCSYYRDPNDRGGLQRPLHSQGQKAGNHRHAMTENELRMIRKDYDKQRLNCFVKTTSVGPRHIKYVRGNDGALTTELCKYVIVSPAECEKLSELRKAKGVRFRNRVATRHPLSANHKEKVDKGRTSRNLTTTRRHGKHATATNEETSHSDETVEYPDEDRERYLDDEAFVGQMG